MTTTTDNTVQFTVHNKETAQDPQFLAGVEKKYGGIPNLIGILAEAPIAAQAYGALGELLTKASFTPTERHVVWFTINAYHNCEYCMAAHTLIAKGEKVSEDVIETARTVGAYADPKLEALRKFTHSVVDSRGNVDPADLNAFLAAGFTKQNVLEILVAVSHKVLSNYTNHIANTPVDENFQKFAWENPAGA